MSAVVGPCYAPRDYAGFWRRTLALVLDAIFLLLVRAMMFLGWYFGVPGAQEDRASLAWPAIGWWLIALVYLFGFRFTTRGTPGYRLVGIRYAYILAGEPPWQAIALRSLAAILLWWLFALDHFWILFDARKQAWHDKVSGFYVVKRKAQPIGTERVVQRVTNFLGMTFVSLEPASGDERAPRPADGA